VDGTTQFHNIIRQFAILNNSVSVLEIGPTKNVSLTTSFLKNKFEKLNGLDVDENAMQNPVIDEIKIYNGINMPYNDRQFDLIVSDYVNEHIENPIQHFREIDRILKKGGIYIARTPQTFYYVIIASRIIPGNFHGYIASSARRLDEHNDGVFPTFYRANTRSFYKKILPRHISLRLIESYQIECEPAYVFNSRILFYLGLIYERIVNRFNFLSFLRANIIVVMHKPEE
jgi:SAM-dependent methyltransferase